MGTIEKLRADKQKTYTGVDITWDVKKKEFSIGQDRYAAEVKTTLTEQEKRRKFNADDLKQTEPGDINPMYRTAQQAWTGVLGWLAKTQPHLSVVFSEISRNCNRPSERSVLSARRACEYAKQTHKRLVFNAIKEPVVVWWVDASYSIRTCDGRVGWEAQVIESSSLTSNLSLLTRNNLVSWRSRRCERKLASTTSAELMGLQDGVKSIPAYTRLIESLWRVKPKVVFVTDSQPLLGWLRTGWV